MNILREVDKSFSVKMLCCLIYYEKYQFDKNPSFILIIGVSKIVVINILLYNL